jgi:tetratricopeptide (TPR) repeat protein
VLGLAGLLGGCHPPTRAAVQPAIPAVRLDGFSPHAREQVRQALEEERAHPDDAAAAGRLGMVLQAYEQFEPAATCYERAHRLDPGEMRWAYYLGWISTLLGRPADAVTVLQEALRRDGDYTPARLKLAQALLLAGRREESRQEYVAILRRHADSAAAYEGLGRIHADAGEWREAAEAYRRACELDPAFGGAHYGLGLAYRHLGRIQPAQQQFNAARSSPAAAPAVDDPLLNEVTDLRRSAEDFARRGAELAKEGRLPEAEAACERALEIDPQNVVACSNLITICSRRRQTERAEEYYRTALHLNPNFPPTHFAYGLHLLRLGDLPRAEAAFHRTLAADPHHADAHSNLGYLLEQRGQTAQAEQQYRAALANGPGSRAAHYNLGRLLVRRRRYDEGIAHLARAAGPDDALAATYRYDLAAACAEAGRRREAVAYARRARQTAQAYGQGDAASKAEALLKRLGAGERG